jgi:single-strand DNA-binding protein
VEFGLASNRRFTTNGEQREEVTFVDCSAFGRQAEVINQYCQKGKPIFIEGRLKFDSWEDRTSGQKRSKLSVVVDNFQFLGGRDDAGGGGGGGDARGGYDESSDYGGGGGSGGSRPPQRRNDRAAPAPAPASKPADEPFDDQEQFGEDDIPF